ncbi:MAG: rRNA (uracil1498-N3)-methyltransferase [Actinomycetota bacterium]|nr:rRNA (uracil1498-N3)-methyltransferase [Actinomycetota bacterium]
MAAAHVFVADLAAPEVVDGDRHHLERVLRLRVGEAVTASDGAGRWVACRWVGGATLEVDGEVVAEPAPAPAITVAFAPPKGERPEWAVQKLTELGVDRIVPLAAARSVVRWTGDRAEAVVARWRRVAREASMQSRRAWLPAVEGAVPFGDASGWPGAVLAVAGGDPPSLDHATVLVGPEGGWSADEGAGGLPTVGLGPHVLRTETAAVAAGTLLVALRSGLLAPHR